MKLKLVILSGIIICLFIISSISALNWYDKTETSVTLGYNHTSAVNTLYGKWFYNMTSPFTDWLATFNYNYNQTYTGGTYNVSYANYAYNMTTASIYYYNMSDGTGADGSYNSSYEKWNYNTTEAVGYAGTYNVTYNGLIKWDYNQSQFIIDTYGKWFYNMTTSGADGSYNATYNSLNSTLNSTYVPYTGANQNVNLGQKNLTTTNSLIAKNAYLSGTISADNINTTGSQVFIMPDITNNIPPYNRTDTLDTCIGYQSCAYTNDFYATAVGYKAGGSTEGAGEAALNSYFGYQAGYNSNLGSSLFIGSRAGQDAGIGTNNYGDIFIGTDTGGESNCTTSIYLGTGAGYLAGTYGYCYDNIGIGAYAMRETNRSYVTTALGGSAGRYSKGSGNLYLGNFAGYNNTGSNVIAIGTSALTHNTKSGLLVISTEQRSLDKPFILGDIDDGELAINWNRTGYDDPNLPYSFNVNGTGLFTLDIYADKFIGAGTRTINAPITVKGANKDTPALGAGSTSSSNSTMNFVDTADNVPKFGFRIGSANDAPLFLDYRDGGTGASKMALSLTRAGGFFGFGTSIPQNRLDVNGSMNLTGNFSGNQFYGEFSNKVYGGFETINLVDPEVYVKITNSTCGLQNGFTCVNQTGNLTANVAGVYKFSLTISAEAVATAGEYGTKLFINGVGKDNCYAFNNFLNGDSSSGGFDCIVRVNAGEIINIGVDDHASPVRDLVLNSINLNAVRIGN